MRSVKLLKETLKRNEKIVKLISLKTTNDKINLAISIRTEQSNFNT